MQPLKLIIPGEFWDSFIYKGRLYLFCLDGSVLTLKWDAFIENWRVDPALNIVFKSAFQRSDYLYRDEVQELLRDDEVLPVITKKFERLAQSELHATPLMIQRAVAGHQTTPAEFPHADIDIYGDQLFMAGRSGLYMAKCSKKTKHPISTKVHRRWDAPILSVAASYGTLALAAGSDGLFELSASPYEFSSLRDPRLVSESPCRDCSWAYYSLFASSDRSGYLADYKKNLSLPGGELARDFEKLETARQIFGSDGYSWGLQDKLCQATENVIKVVKYRPWETSEQNRIQSIGQVTFEEWKGMVVSASTASFGVIVELENALVVFPSVGQAITIPGEPVNWRNFPKSKHYENQLHIVYDDRLEILSFNHDYLADQDAKLLGFTVFNGGREAGMARVAN